MAMVNRLNSAAWLALVPVSEGTQETIVVRKRFAITCSRDCHSRSFRPSRSGAAALTVRMNTLASPLAEIRWGATSGDKPKRWPFSAESERQMTATCMVRGRLASQLRSAGRMTPWPQATVNPQFSVEISMSSSRGIRTRGRRPLCWIGVSVWAVAVRRPRRRPSAWPRTTAAANSAPSWFLKSERRCNAAKTSCQAVSRVSIG